MEGLKKVWAWVKANVVGLLVGLVAVLGAGWLWGYHRRRVRSLEDELAVERAQRRVAALDARRKALEERGAEAAAELAALESERREVQRQTVALAGDVAALSDEEVERAFRDLY